MTSDTRQAFKAALKTLITGVSSDFALVTDSRELIEKFTTDNYPLVRINEMESQAVHNVTSCEINIIRFEIAIAVKADVSDDTLAGYCEAIADSIRDNPQVSDTCDYCLAETQMQPNEWEEAQYKVRYLNYKVMLRRSV